MTNSLSFDPLIDLYTRMDDAWQAVARLYPFECNGCTDNCCQSLFFHHTHVEQKFFLHGFKQLPQTNKEAILHRAREYCQKTFDQPGDIHSLKIMCPANENGRCCLYPFRPMICRLHGLPHELKRPGGDPVQGPGCNFGKFDPNGYIPFDRTLFYQEMAAIELRFRKTLNLSGRVKQTIAQMLISS